MNKDNLEILFRLLAICCFFTTIYFAIKGNAISWLFFFLAFIFHISAGLVALKIKDQEIEDLTKE